MALGVWQSQRYYWKLEQIDQRAATLARAPVPLPTCVDGIDPRLLAGLLIMSCDQPAPAFFLTDHAFEPTWPHTQGGGAAAGRDCGALAALLRHGPVPPRQGAARRCVKKKQKLSLGPIKNEYMYIYVSCPGLTPMGTHTNEHAPRQRHDTGPRSAPKSIHGPAQGLGTGPQGHYILTPFETADGFVVYNYVYIIYIYIYIIII